MAETEINQKAEEILGQMTLKEKVEMCSGLGMCFTQDMPRFGLPRLLTVDGPHGIRIQEGSKDNLGITKGVPATAFPTLSALACSFDKGLLEEIGAALGEEAYEYGVSVVLGPGINIKRSPLCGRNFEYFSEDPVLAGHLAAAYIDGVQKKGIGTSLKHFAFNNKEHFRQLSESVVDDRAAREIYLPAFEYAVKHSQPYEVMAAYNLYKGEFASESKTLLTDILREEWGFEGIVMSDYGACDDRAKGLLAGQDIEFPPVGSESIYDGLKKGVITVEHVEAAARRNLRMILKCLGSLRPGYRYDREAHHGLAARACAASAVLLKNDGVLPLRREGAIAVVGEFAEKAKIQGGGSSAVNPTRVVSLLDALNEDGISCVYAPGYRSGEDVVDSQLIDEAVSAAKNADTVILCAGLITIYESESVDRKHMGLTASHLALINRVAEVNDNIVLVLFAGAPVELPFEPKTRAILDVCLGGQGVGTAIRDILFGRVNPSGKLAETFPLKLEDTPSYHYFPGGSRAVYYAESVFVGYRYYDSAGVDVQYPFGHGLSYTSFRYSGIAVNGSGYDYTVTCQIENTGDCDGAEIVQLYVKNAASSFFRPEKELRGFEKIFLRKGERKTVAFRLAERDFAFYDNYKKRWTVEKGEYEILLAASSRDIRLKHALYLDGEETHCPLRKSLIYYNLRGNGFSPEDFRALLGHNPPPPEREPGHPFDLNSSLGEMSVSAFGRWLLRFAKKIVTRNIPEEGADAIARHMDQIIGETPIRGMVQMSNGILSFDMARGVTLILNKKRCRGALKIIKNLPRAVIGAWKTL